MKINKSFIAHGDCRRDGEASMKDLWSILKAALRASLWRSTTAEPQVRLRIVLFWMVASMAAEATRQYVMIGDAAAFSIYGINTIIAEAAVLAVVGLVVFSNNRATALAQLFALITLAELAAIVAARLPALVLLAALVAVGLLYFSRNRTAVLSKMFALAVLAELVVVAATRLPAFDRPSMWPALDIKILLFITLLIWWTGAVAALLRGILVPYKSPVFRAVGLTAMSVMAMAASPAFPAFVGGSLEPSFYNLWEWASAKLYQPDREAAPPIDVASVELAQPSLLEAEATKLLPERRGKSDIYAIGIAGWSDQDVFVKELNGGLAALDNAVGLDRGTIRLVNHPDTVEKLPVANRSNFASAVRSIAKVMNREEDILLLFITSHGGPAGVALRLSGAPNAMLSPDNIATTLDREGIKNRILIVSACYAGVFVTRLASPDSVILTAADDKNPSFGCSNEREWTYFGDALFNQNLAGGVSLEDAFASAKEKILKWEAKDELPPSNPQGFFGASLSEKLHSKLRTSEHQAVANEP